MLQKGAQYLLKNRKICFRIDFHLNILYTLYFNTLQCIYFIWWTVFSRNIYKFILFSVLIIILRSNNVLFVDIKFLTKVFHTKRKQIMNY